MVVLKATLQKNWVHPSSFQTSNCDKFKIWKSDITKEALAQIISRIIGSALRCKCCLNLKGSSQDFVIKHFPGNEKKQRII